MKKMEPDPEALLRSLRRWRDEAGAAGHAVRRTAVAFEAGRELAADGAPRPLPAPRGRSAPDLINQ